MFSQECVIPSVDGGGGCILACNGARGGFAQGGVCPMGVCPGSSYPGGVCSGGLPGGERGLIRGEGVHLPLEMATEAGGTHPTRMHSC